MIHFCLFGGHEVELFANARVFLTFCGGCEGRWPTIARQLIELRERGQAGLPPRRIFFLTVMGATELKIPTLAEEFVALQDAVRAGVLTRQDIDRGIAQLGLGGTLRISSFTVMGGFENGTMPTEDEELDRLAMHNQMGAISPEVTELLIPAAGQKGINRPVLIRQALEASFAGAQG